MEFSTLEIQNPPEKPFHEQYLREAAFNLLVDAGVMKIGDWVVCSMADEWYYHDPRKIVNAGVEPWANVISWNQLNILPHPSEKRNLSLLWRRLQSNKDFQTLLGKRQLQDLF